MARIVITGGAGFLGSHLCDRFLDRGDQVVALDNLSTGAVANIEHLFGRPGFTFVEHDVTRFVWVPGPVDAVLHFASPASPVDYLELPIQTLKVGSLGTHNSLGLAKAKGARFLLASTSEVYGDPDVHPQPETYWGNVNPIGPRGVYDEAKRFAEAMTMAYHRSHGLDVRIVRIFNVYGPRMRPGDGRVVSNFLVQALQGKPAHHLRRRQPDPQLLLRRRRDRAASWPCSTADSTGPLNIGNPGEFTVAELADLVLEVTGSDSPIVFEDAAGGRSPPAPARPHPHHARAGLAAQDRPARGPRAHGGLLPPAPGRRAAAGVPGRTPRPLDRRLRRVRWRGPRPRRGGVRYQSRVRRQAVVEVGDGLEAELLLGPAGVDAPAGLAVGLGRVPADLALEADEVADDGRPGRGWAARGRRRG